MGWKWRTARLTDLDWVRRRHDSCAVTFTRPGQDGLRETFDLDWSGI